MLISNYYVLGRHGAEEGTVVPCSAAAQIVLSISAGEYSIVKTIYGNAFLGSSIVLDMFDRRRRRESVLSMLPAGSTIDVSGYGGPQLRQISLSILANQDS